MAVASEGCPPITTRRLESLVRLAEARARLDLRQVPTHSSFYPPTRDAPHLPLLQRHDELYHCKWSFPCQCAVQR